MPKSDKPSDLVSAEAIFATKQYREACIKLQDATDAYVKADRAEKMARAELHEAVRACEAAGVSIDDLAEAWTSDALAN